MAFSFGYFADAGLTTQASLTFTQESDGSTGPVDEVVYFGSTETGRKLEANSQPGVDQITISVTDTAPGSGHETTEVKLALTAAGLDTAVAGGSLDVGTVINSEPANSVEIHVRVEDATGTVGVSTELGITSNEVIETAQ